MWCLATTYLVKGNWTKPFTIILMHGEFIKDLWNIWQPISAALINQCVFRDTNVVHSSATPGWYKFSPLPSFSTLSAKAPRALTHLTLHLICITVLVCSNSTPTAKYKAVITLYGWHFTYTHLTAYPSQPSHTVGVLRGAQGWMYLNQKATGSCSKLQPNSGSSPAVCPWLQAASLLTQKVLQVHRQPFVYQMSHGPQNHQTYHHTLLQAAQYPLTSVWGLLAASADWSCHWHAGLCRKFPNAVNTNTVRGQRGETRPEKPRGWWCTGAILSSLRETGGPRRLPRQGSPTLSSHWNHRQTLWK